MEQRHRFVAPWTAAISLLAISISSLPASAQDYNSTKTIQGPFTLKYLIKMKELGYENIDKPQLVPSLELTEPEGYELTISQRDGRLLIESRNRRTWRVRTLLFDGKRSYAYWQGENRLTVFPGGILLGSVHIAMMSNFWPGTGLPYIPFMKSARSTDGQYVGMVADTLRSIGMKPGMEYEDNPIQVENKKGVLLTREVAFNYDANHPRASWQFSDYRPFKNVQVAKKVVWKTYPRPTEMFAHVVSEYALPYYTMECTLESAEDRPLDSKRFDPNEWINGEIAYPKKESKSATMRPIKIPPLLVTNQEKDGKFATIIDWFASPDDPKKSGNLTFIFDPKLGDLEANYRYRLNPPKDEDE